MDDYTKAMEAWFKNRVQTIYESPPDPEWFAGLEKDGSVPIAPGVRPDIFVFTTTPDYRKGQDPAIFQELSKAMQVGLGDNFTQLGDKIYLARQITATVEGVTVYGKKDYI